MWFFNKKTSLIETGVFSGLIDCHSHILPGVDDGIHHMETALEVLEYYEQLGVSEVWLTPHIMEDVPNNPEGLRRRFRQLSEAYDAQPSEGTKVKLHLSAENMLDSLFVKRLAAGDVLPYGRQGKELLVETSYVQAPFRFRSILREIQDAGYTPVLAHPERYRYMDYDDYDSLRSEGVLFQMNILSLVGAYGKEPQERAEVLLSEDAYAYRGTDIHSLSHFKKEIAEKRVDKYIKEIL